MVLLASVMGAAASVAIGVAAMGLWAVAALGVARRRREFGVRLAVGAERAAIARMLLAESLRMSGIGLAGGVMIAAPIFLLMRSELVGVEPWDPFALAGTLAVLGSATLAASIGPALRAAHVDPLEILRAE
jgi:ABC-type antimicrobial peptide transport system permease subunit